MGKKLPPKQLKLYTKIDEILFYQWDPIGISVGISDDGWSRNEYRMYLPKVFELALKDDSPKPIAEYLTWVSTERMGLKPVVSHDMRIAELILDIKEQCLE